MVVAPTSITRKDTGGAALGENGKKDMSKKGIKLAAEAFGHLQRIRVELLSLGGEATLQKSGSGNQDIRLAQLLDDVKDSVKDRFVEETLKPEAQV